MAAPSLLIINPQRGQIVDMANVVMTGTTYDPDTFVSRVICQARIPDVGIAGPYTGASIDAGGNWAALVTVPDNRYTRLVAIAYDSVGNSTLKFVDVVYSSEAVIPPPSTLVPVSTPVISVGSYLVTVSKSGTTITSRDNAGSTKYSGAHAVSAIDAAIDAVRAKTTGGTVHINPGDYNLSGYFTLCNNLILEGDSRTTTTLRCTKSYSDMIRAGSANKNIVIRKLGVNGMGISGKVLSVSGITNMILRDLILERHNENNNGPGVYLGSEINCTVFNCISRNHSGNGDSLGVGGTNIRVLNCELYRTVQGGSITSGGIINGEIAYNHVHDSNTYAGTSFENQSRRTYRVDVHHNLYERFSYGNAILVLGYLNNTYSFDSVFIRDNTMTDIFKGAACKLGAFDNKVNKRLYNFKIYNNRMTNTNYSAINAGPMDNCDIYNNVIDRCNPYGVRLYTASKNVRMNNNTITNYTKAKYYYTGSSDIYVNGVKVA